MRISCVLRHEQEGEELCRSPWCVSVLEPAHEGERLIFFVRLGCLALRSPPRLSDHSAGRHDGLMWEDAESSVSIRIPIPAESYRSLSVTTDGKAVHIAWSKGSVRALHV